MNVIAFATTKGGSGKTTLTVALATALANSAQKVVALDTDPNKNLSIRVGDVPFRHREVAEEQIMAAVREEREAGNIVVIDVAGALSRGMLYAISVANAVIIPCRPDRTDVIEAARTQDVLRQAEEMTGRTIPHAALLTQVNRRAQVTAVTRDQLTALGVPCLASELPLRTAYQAASWSGFPLSDSHVQADIKGIAADIAALMGA